MKLPRVPYLLLLSMLVFLSSCQKDDSKPKDSNPSDGPEMLDFPDCNLVETKFEASYGTTENMYFEYAGSQLVRRDFFVNGNYNSTKLFAYDDDGNPTYMLTADSGGTAIDTIASYEFFNGLLVGYKHFNTDNGEVLTVETYTYENGRLAEQFVETDGTTTLIALETDDYGNPTAMDILEINGSPPAQTIRIEYVYDNSFNPYYRLPDFTQLRYFSQNNLVSRTTFIDGVEDSSSEVTLEYDDSNLLATHVDEFSQGIHTTEFIYDCE